jgi:hypothetical protein
MHYAYKLTYASDWFPIPYSDITRVTFEYSGHVAFWKNSQIIYAIWRPYEIRLEPQD